MPKQISLKEFITQCHSKHHNKYDYTKVRFEKVKDKVCIICPIHGEFWQIAWEHKNGSGCPICAREYASECNKSNTEDFIIKAKKKHGDRYDYTKSIYKGSHENICIICREHGEFWQTANSHLSGCGCPKCSQLTNVNKRKLTTEEFIKRAKAIHGDTYDYSKVDYKGIFEPVIIICPKHGEFKQIPNAHINEKKGCVLCGNERNGLKHRRFNQEEFIAKAKEIHGDKYDYSKVEYTTLRERVCIICPEHGEFWQTPHKHIDRKQGCPKCGLKLLWNNRGRRNTEEFIELANKVHGNKYDYSKVEYEASRKKVCITCPIHGDFWKTPNKHLQGQGCPICSKGVDVMSDRIGKMLEERYPIYTIIREYSDKDIFGQKRIDYFIQEYNIAIEYQGRQHFAPVEKFGGYNALVKQIKLDEEKYKECQDNNIKLLYFTFTDRDVPTNYIDKVYTNFDELCRVIDNIIDNKK